MRVLPPFNEDGVLPQGTYQLSLEEILNSILIAGSDGHETWNADWRLRLLDGLGLLIGHLSQVHITEIFIDGSFVSDKAIPNDIDGYFIVDRSRWISGEIQSLLSKIDPIWTWKAETRAPFKAYPKPQLPMWHKYRVELFPDYGQACGLTDADGRHLTFAEAFRQSRQFKPKGIIKIRGLS